jgi:HemY protein
MIRILVSCVILALAVWAGVAMQATHGYVGINFAGWTIEAPIWLAVIALIMTSILIVSVFKVVHILMNLKAFFHQLRTERRLKQAKVKTTQGMLAFLEGHWQEAEEALVEGAACIDLPFINYVFAAKAAGEQDQIEKAEQYLQTAEKLTKDQDSLAYELKRGQLLCQQNKWSEALALLEPVLEKQSTHAQLIKWVYKIHEHQKNWEKIIDLVPLLIKAKIFSEEKGIQIQKHAYCERMLHAESVSLAEVKTLWKDMPKAYHADAHLVYLYASALLEYHLQDEAESILRQAIKRQWSEVLIKLYGKVKSTLPQKQLAFAEHWLKEYPKSAVLLLTVGRICLHHQLWGKAQRYLEASITLSPQPETFSELGKLLMKLNKLEEAAEYFRHGLLMLTNQGQEEEPLLGAKLPGITAKLEPAEHILQD